MSQEVTHLWQTDQRLQWLGEGSRNQNSTEDTEHLERFERSCVSEEKDTACM